jgi:anthranilate synthase component 1
MLLDLARNDVNRVCDPATVKVEELMVLQKFSHVIHLTSTVTGNLRENKTRSASRAPHLSAGGFFFQALIQKNFRFDAFRSIFPAGTVSGAPKIKAIELVFGLEKERRAVYAGGVGRWDFANDEMDVAIAIRTMTFKDGNVYFQAGGGIVFDSVEEDEYEETIRKLSANIKAIEEAESKSISGDLALHLIELIPFTLRIPLHSPEGR